MTEDYSLINGIDNRISFLIVEYMTTIDKKTRQIFGDAQYSYLKTDLAPKQRPACFVYPISSEKNSFSFSQTGRMLMTLNFSLQNQRQDLAMAVVQIANDVQLINLRGEFTKHLQANMGGLFWFGKSCRVDYSAVYNRESVVKIEFDYHVDLTAYNNWLENNGYSLSSPDEVVYYPAKLLLLQSALI